jgi:hypothetical protein
MLKYYKQKGFGTLYIVIIVGGIVLSLSLWLSTSSFWSIHNGVNLKTSQQTKSLVEACAEVALETLRENQSFIGSDTVSIGDNSCAYDITSLGGDSRSIDISGSIGSVTRKLLVTTESFNPIIVTDWQEGI